MLLSLIYSTRETLLLEGIRNQVMDMFSVGGYRRADEAYKHFFGYYIRQNGGNGILRHDQIIWLARWYRLYHIRSSSLNEYDEALFDKLCSDMAKKFNTSEEVILRSVNSLQIDKLVSIFVHCNGIQYAPIQDYRLSYQLPSQVEQELQELETKYKEKYPEDQNSTAKNSSHSLVMDLGDYAWYNLNKNACDEEARLMGHCGNAGGSDEETILSLRKKMQKDKLRPVLTFIRHADGYLGEMKGRFNEKPDPQYHPYILPLILSDEVSGIRGGGYLPKNNFMMSDLSMEKQIEIIDIKPELFESSIIATTMSKYVTPSKWVSCFNEVYDLQVKLENGYVILHNPDYYLETFPLGITSDMTVGLRLSQIVSDAIEKPEHRLIYETMGSIGSFASIIRKDSNFSDHPIVSKIKKLGDILNYEYGALEEVYTFIKDKAAKASINSMYINLRNCKLYFQNTHENRFHMFVEYDKFLYEMTNVDDTINYILKYFLVSYLETMVDINKTELETKYDQLLIDMENHIDMLIERPRNDQI